MDRLKSRDMGGMRGFSEADHDRQSRTRCCRIRRTGIRTLLRWACRRPSAGRCPRTHARRAPRRNRMGPQTGPEGRKELLELCRRRLWTRTGGRRRSAISGEGIAFSDPLSRPRLCRAFILPCPGRVKRCQAPPRRAPCQSSCHRSHRFGHPDPASRNRGSSVGGGGSHHPAARVFGFRARDAAG